MKVIVFNQYDKKTAGEYEIILANIGSQSLEGEYIEEAWRCAVEDGAVDGKDRDKYGFYLMKQ